MKRTAAAFVLAAGLGGCMSPSTGNKSTGTKTDGMTAAKPDAGMVAPAGGMRAVSDPKRDASVIQASAYGVDGVTRTGRMDAGVRQANFGHKGSGHGGAGSYESTFGPAQTQLGTMLGHGGITPVPPMGPPGAVALVPGAMGGPGGGMAGMYANGRTSVRFVSPEGMKIAFQDASRGFTDAGREAPVRYNFPQGSIYRLRLSGMAKYPGKNYYPTLEVYGPSTKEAMTFLSHTTVPVGFTDEDFDQVRAGNMVVKVIYLPTAQFQDVAAAEEIVSTRLEPGANAVDEAARRGTILAVIRLGNIDLEDPTTPAMDAPPGGMGPGGPPRPGPGMPPPGPGMAPPVPMPPKTDAPVKGGGVPASLPSISLPPVK